MTVLLRNVIAQNIAELRKNNNMTQLELAEKLNYSDKAVSKWERRESVPDVAVLKNIADIFLVTVDYLLEETHKKTAPPAAKTVVRARRRGVITWLGVLIVWMVATIAFVAIQLAISVIGRAWIVFVWAVPVSAIVWLIMNSVWFNRRRNYFIISVLMWTLLAATHITLLLWGMNVWLVYLLGIPAQFIIFLWSGVTIKQADHL
ncbi:MAG: helix-turn-helix transcriptional regulator [Clostridia bacterium]|nr:helix-turn-helix transcriptional regulator [Clostridia bacterium]